MSAMMAAIKKKKMGMGDHQDMGHAAQHADDSGKDLHGLVQSLSHSEKQNLKTLLDADSKGAEQISKGHASSEEKGHIQEAISKENSMNDLEDAEGHDSDDIAKSMLDSKHMSDTLPMDKPRNLGERMKMSLATKLKGKGKI